MIRKSSSIAIALAATLPVIVSADDLASRVDSLEKRVGSLETTLGKSREQAMMSATMSNTTYVIKEGDTLGDIARQHNVPRSSLLEANNLRDGQPIYIGESLVIPSKPSSTNVYAGTTDPAPPKQADPKKAPAPPATPPSAAPPSTASEHKVASGDTLSKISRKYGVSVAALKSANGLKSDVISPGQRIKIPGAGSAAQTTSAPDTGSSQQQAGSDATYAYDNDLLKQTETYGYYKVTKGDNLYALARDFFTDMPELQRLNKLGKSTVIHPGDELIVPTSKYNSYHNNVASN